MTNTLKLMRCSTCQESNVVNRPDIVERIPNIIEAMRRYAHSITLNGFDDKVLRTTLLVWADQLEGK